MLRLDYLSCLLTVLSTILVGRRLWYGWILAGANSVIICVIGLRTSQPGFIAANVFCLALYAWNLVHWKTAAPVRSASYKARRRASRTTPRVRHSHALMRMSR